MFYAHFVLSKKGPLAKIWLAAHWDKKLTKAHVFETNIESSVEGILQPKAKLALRTSGHLLLGIVRIYSRKAKYLLADCNEAFIKIKMAFRPGIVDLPEGNREAAVATITLPEVFHDFDTTMPDITIDMDAQVSLNQSRAEDITLKEDYGTLSLMADDGFEDMPFEPETGRDVSNMEDAFDHASLLLGDEASKEQQIDDTIQNASTADSTISKPNASLDVPLKDDGFGGAVGEGLLDGESGALFEPAGLFDDAPLGDVPLEQNEPNDLAGREAEKTTDKPPEQRNDESSDDDMYDMAPGSIGAPSPPTSPETPPPQAETDLPCPESAMNDATIVAPEAFAPPEAPSHSAPPAEEPPPLPPPVQPLDHTTLIHNEDESFALAPLDATISHGPERTVKAKRKRKLIVDEVKNISGEEMKSQLSDTSDIVTTLDLAPPTKRLMQWKETGGVEKLFALPGYRILSKTLSRAYQRHLTTRSVENEDFDFDDRIDLDAEVEQPLEDPDVSGMHPRKKPCRDIIDHSFPQDQLQMNSLTLEASRASYASEHSLTHPSLDLQNFLPNPHHMFSTHPDQMMGNIMQQPPPAHMIQQIIPTDMNLSSMMHPSMMDQGPPLHAINPIVQNPDIFNHFNPPEHIQHPPLDKAAPIQNDLDEQTLPHDPIPQDISNIMDNNLHQPQPENQTAQPQVDGHGLHPHPDEEATQQCNQNLTNSNTMHNSHLPVVNHLGEVGPSEKSGTQQMDQNAEFNALFDSLQNGDHNHSENVTQSLQNELHHQNGDQQKQDELVMSDDDDYGAPASVGPMMPEEQMADETYEQFEERILSKRTTHMLHIIDNKLDQDKIVNFSRLVKHNKRKQVAQKFYTLLVLKKMQAVELEQSCSYGEMVISKGPKFDTVLNS